MSAKSWISEAHADASLSALESTSPLISARVVGMFVPRSYHSRVKNRPVLGDRQAFWVISAPKKARKGGQGLSKCVDLRNHNPEVAGSNPAPATKQNQAISGIETWFSSCTTARTAFPRAICIRSVEIEDKVGASSVSSRLSRSSCSPETRSSNVPATQRLAGRTFRLRYAVCFVAATM